MTMVVARIPDSAGSAAPGTWLAAVSPVRPSRWRASHGEVEA
jgi:hypothetical protein